jgi:hypothetical protein
MYRTRHILARIISGLFSRADLEDSFLTISSGNCVVEIALISGLYLRN